jgi:hypothetical protein
MDQLALDAHHHPAALLLVLQHLLGRGADQHGMLAEVHHRGRLLLALGILEHLRLPGLGH